MTVEFKQHFVAFLDILGFSEMVKSDSSLEKDNFLAKLFRCHQKASTIFANDPNCSIIQFSDSIVIAKPFQTNLFERFATSVAEYQRLLLNEHLLCRGGIAVNKHFSNGTFTFSAGLLEAYRVESTMARYPRVVVSKDVIELLFPDLQEPPPYLVREDDGLYFVDYLGLTGTNERKNITIKVKEVFEELMTSENSSVREKGLWIAMYSDAVLKTKIGLPKFTGDKIRARNAQKIS